MRAMLLKAHAEPDKKASEDPRWKTCDAGPPVIQGADFEGEPQQRPEDRGGQVVNLDPAARMATGQKPGDGARCNQEKCSATV